MGSLKNSRVFNFAILAKLQKFDAREIYMFYGIKKTDVCLIVTLNKSNLSNINKMTYFCLGDTNALKMYFTTKRREMKAFVGDVCYSPLIDNKHTVTITAYQITSMILDNGRYMLCICFFSEK